MQSALHLLALAPRGHSGMLESDSESRSLGCVVAGRHMVATCNVASASFNDFRSCRVASNQFRSCGGQQKQHRQKIPEIRRTTSPMEESKPSENKASREEEHNTTNSNDGFCDCGQDDTPPPFSENDSSSPRAYSAASRASLHGDGDGSAVSMRKRLCNLGEAPTWAQRCAYMAGVPSGMGSCSRNKKTSCADALVDTGSQLLHLRALLPKRTYGVEAWCGCWWSAKGNGNRSWSRGLAMGSPRGCAGAYLGPGKHRCKRGI